MLSTAVANVDVVCAANEMLKFEPLSGMTCGEYLDDYINGVDGMQGVGGYLEDRNSTTMCSYCPMDKTNTFLAQVGSYYDERWRNFGYVFFSTPHP